MSHGSWNPEFSARSGQKEIFTQDALIANRVNMLFYNQFPSLVTGIGLLLTFIALFIGLGKLHAEGSEIIGIQGLINGLAGKFLTSIVGLIVANLFTFMEKPIIARLMDAHHTFVDLVDQLFPRKTMEQMLEQLTSLTGDREGHQLATPMVARGAGSGLDKHGLANLTSILQALKSSQEEEQEETRHTLSGLPRSIRDELQVPLRELTETIHDLTKILKDAQPLLATVESPFEKRPFLWKNVSKVMDPSATIRPQKSRAWPRWPRFSKLRRAG